MVDSMLSQSQRQELISTYPLFSLLPPDKINKLAELMYEITIPKGFAIVREGQVVDSLYLIYSGEMEVSCHSLSKESADEIIVAKLNKGDAIGIADASFFSRSGMRTATVVALSEVRLLGISLHSFREFMREVEALYPGLSKKSDTILHVNMIKSVEPFFYVQSEYVDRIIKRLKEISVAAGQIIFRQGDPTDKLYFIQKGEVEIIAKNGSNDVRRVLKPPTMLGELSLLILSHHHVTARAKEDCQLIEFSNAIFIQHMQQDSATTHVVKILKKNSKLCPHQVAGINYTESQTNAGQPLFKLSHPHYPMFYRLSTEGWFVWQLLDGKHTVQEIIKLYTEKFTLADPELIILLIAHLRTNHFVNIPIPIRTNSMQYIKDFFAKIFRK